MSSGTLPSAPAAQGSSFPHQTTRLQPPRSPPHPPVAARSPLQTTRPVWTACTDNVHARIAAAAAAAAAAPPPLPPSLPLPLPRIPTSPSSISFERYVLPACVGAHSGKELVLLSLSPRCRRAVLRLSSGRPRAELRLSSGCSRVAFGRSSGKLCAVVELSSSCRRCYHPHVIALLSRCHRAAVERPLFCRRHAATAAADDDDDHEDRDVLDDREILLCTWQQATHETAKESEWSRIVHSRWVPACFSPITQQPDDRAVP